MNKNIPENVKSGKETSEKGQFSKEEIKKRTILTRKQLKKNNSEKEISGN